jgi:hypothetical protein
MLFPCHSSALSALDRAYTSATVSILVQAVGFFASACLWFTLVFLREIITSFHFFLIHRSQSLFHLVMYEVYSREIVYIVVQLCHVADSQIRIKPLIKHSLFATFPCYSSNVVFTTLMELETSNPFKTKGRYIILVWQLLMVYLFTEMTIHGSQ